MSSERLEAGKTDALYLSLPGVNSRLAGESGRPLFQHVGAGLLMVWISATGRSVVVVVVRASRAPLRPSVEVQVKIGRAHV